MAKFPEAVVASLFASCRRHCCICLRFSGQRMHIHHIVPESEDGPGTADNGIPVCLDCHAEVESKSNMGRRFTADELKQHRDNWFSIVRDRPEVLIRAAQTWTATGPLEALIAELDFNRVAVEGHVDEEFPPLLVSQFERAIATNALAALDETTREDIQITYKNIRRVNFFFEEMARVDRIGGRGTAFLSTVGARNELRGRLMALIPDTILRMKKALGWDVF